MSWFGLLKSRSIWMELIARQTVSFGSQIVETFDYLNLLRDNFQVVYCSRSHFVPLLPLCMDHSSINSIEWRDLPKPKHPRACISLVMVSVAKRGVQLFHHHHPKHHHAFMSSFSQPLPSRLSVVAQRQGDSDEIGVFEATRYFSGGVDGEGLGLQGVMGEDRVSWVAGRKSLDTVLRAILPRRSKKGENQRKDDNKCRKLATFLCSFFNQTIYEKKSQSEKDRNLKEMQAGRRRSSISYSQTIRSNEGYSNGRTNGHQKSVHFSSQREAWYHNRVTSEVWPAERAKSMDGYPENKCGVNGNGDGLSKEEALASEEFMEKEELAMRMEEEDGGGSDSSSDLFELKTYEM